MSMASYKCPDCNYVYDESAGNVHEGFSPGTPWHLIPEDWCCPDCAVRDKLDFMLIESGVGEKGVTSTHTSPNLSEVSGTSLTAEAVVAPTSLEKLPSADVKGQDLYKTQPPRSDAQGGKAYLKWICITCGHIYDEALGDEAEGFTPGTRFEDIPDDWCCPDCGATKEDYVLYEEK